MKLPGIVNWLILVVILTAAVFIFTPGGVVTFKQLISPEVLKYYFSPKYPKPSENWIKYHLSNISFEVPENYSVKIFNNYQAEIKYYDKGGGGVYLDLDIYKSLASYEDAIKYYKSYDKFKDIKIRETNYGAFINGQRYEFLGLGEGWGDFIEIIVPINNKIILLRYFGSSKKAIDPQVFEKIAETVKPI